MNEFDQSRARTATVRGKVPKEAKARLGHLVRELGHDGEEQLVGQAVERLLQEADWIEEIRRRKAVPRGERVYVHPDDMRSWAKARTGDRPLPIPEGKSLADL